MSEENLIYIQESHGILPSECQCGGFLDFANKEELQCRKCKTLYNIDSLLEEIDAKRITDNRTSEDYVSSIRR